MKFAYIVYVFFTLFFIAEAYSIPKNSIAEDTIQSHYESIIDDIISEHNEALLGRLSVIIKAPSQMRTTLASQAELILRTQSANIKDDCITRIPGMVANQVHELRNVLYSSVEGIVSNVWTMTDQEMAQTIKNSISEGCTENQALIDELGGSLEILNMDVAEKIMQTLQNFDLLSKMKSLLQACQSTTNDLTDSKFTEKVWSAVLLSFNESPTISIYAVKNYSDAFLNSYLIGLVSDIQSELYSGVDDLARKIYEDLAAVY